MSKKIAVVLRDRQSEALRMAVGITLMDDSIDVFVLDRKLERNEQIDLYLETIEFMEMGLFTNVEVNADMTLMGTGEIAARLLQYDHVLAY